jgi:hypothetical protein
MAVAGRTHARGDQDPLAQLPAWLGVRRNLGQRRGYLAELPDRPQALRALRCVASEALLVRGLQSMQDVPGRQLIEFGMTGLAGLIGHDDPSPAGSLWAERVRCSRRMAANVRVFTVPSGTPVNCAISRWVYPPK